MDRRRDPRTIVTPYAFSVHPDLLGLPLATPWQRLGAITLDAVVIVGLSRIGAVTLAIASGLLLFWLAIRKPGRDVFGKLFRLAVGCLGVLVLTSTLAVWWVVNLAKDPERLERYIGDAAAFADSAGIDVSLEGLGESDTLGLAELLRLLPGLASLPRVDNPQEAREVAAELARLGRDQDMSLQDIRGALTALMPKNVEWSDESQGIIDDVMADLRRGLPGTPADDGSQATPQTAEAPAISDPVAMDSIRALNQLVVTLDEERQDVEQQLDRIQTELEEAENAGILDWLWNLIDDLGLGFGWGALYMTITHALLNGSSLGKKLFRIRVVMIDKRPLNWWLSFERAGGYAAGIATGLLGFAQIFWDPNRQAIHDKVSETFVIQVGKDPVPGPWIAEGKAQWERKRPLTGGVSKGGVQKQ
jgi:uncharacterized RDD family membrane protein YckC